MKIKGRRVDEDSKDKENQFPYPRLEPGDYGKDLQGIWHCCPPQVLGEKIWYLYGSLRNHKIIEHEDKTITVSPSILISVFNNIKTIKTWHGYLEKGIWREPETGSST